VTVHEEEQAVREYETTFIVQPEISDEGREAMLQKLDALIEKQGAVRLAVDDVGKRKLAYEIQKFQKGHYYTLQYLDRGPAVKELERTLRLEESVLRFLTVMVNEEVTDIEGRKAAAAEEERLRKQRAAERAAREAEEERAREQAEREARAAASAAPFANAVDPDDVESDEEPDEDEE
jgi:small subunit ribosomal protein S6